jgi:hypothetical protein
VGAIASLTADPDRAREMGARGWREVEAAYTIEHQAACLAG